jgi:hypothetical protein
MENNKIRASVDLSDSASDSFKNAYGKNLVSLVTRVHLRPKGVLAVFLKHIREEKYLAKGL